MIHSRRLPLYGVHLYGVHLSRPYRAGLTLLVLAVLAVGELSTTVTLNTVLSGSTP